MSAKRYKLRPVFVEAERFDPKKKPWPEGVEDPECYCASLAQDGRHCELHDRSRRWRWKLRTNGFDLVDIFPGDIVIKHTQLLKSRMTFEDFLAKYEPE